MNRREFLGTLAAGTLVTALSGCRSVTGCAKGIPIRIGMAGITYGRFKTDEMISEMVKNDVHGLCVKSFHLPFESTPGEIKAFLGKLSDNGITPYGAGPIAMNDLETAKRMFGYAAAIGVPTLVGVPGEKRFVDGKERIVSSRRLCEGCAKLAEEYKIDFAIHNHGENPKTGNPYLYPSLEKTWPFIRDLGPQMGFCMDVAYTFADGYDPAAVIRTYGGRIFDCHLRNISDPRNGSSGAPAHSGKIDYRPVFRALKEIGYSRWCGLELANAFNPSAANPGADPSWIPQSLGYFRALAEL